MSGLLHTRCRAFNSQALNNRTRTSIRKNSLVGSTGCASHNAQVGRNRFEIRHVVHPTTNTHAHTPIPGTTKYIKTAPTPAWLLTVLLLFAANPRDTFLAAPASAACITRCDIQGAVSMTFAQQRLPSLYSRFGGCRHSATPRIKFLRLRLSPTPTTRLVEGSSLVNHALRGENAQSTDLATNF